MDDSKSSPVDSKQADHPSSPLSPNHAHHHIDSFDNANHNDKSPTDESSPDDMAALVAHNNPALLPVPAGGVNKRYRPAPAKTFQCRGYGECRMVFSRSEHLARHIRKHTGERPFTCHCGKQFSRLDNLRQHAQTVHADKQDQNERMMRELTSLHASMAAANKAGQSRGKRGQANAAAVIAASNQSLPQDNPALHSLDHVKEEDQPSLPIHQRPGTSTGYEGSDNILYHSDQWSDDIDRADSRAHNSHSFRDSTQSFLAPPSASSAFLGSHSQSFLPFPANSFNLGLASRDGRPGSSSSRPPTAGGPDSHARTLPPLSAVVSASIPPPQSQSFSLHPQSTQHLLPLSSTLAFNRRPSTATRPGTAPAAYYNPKPAYAGGPGLVHQPELSLPQYGRAPELAAAAAAAAYRLPYDPEPASPSAASYDSPFSFHPPALTDSLPAPPASSAQGGPLASSPSNPRKRPFPGADGAFDDPSRSGGTHGEYEYGSESRPQSRRLSVLELCNDPDAADPGIRSFLPSAPTGSTSRPTTSSGLVSSASALALVDRAPVPGHALLSGTPSSAAGTVASTTTAPAAATAYGASAQTFGGGGILATTRRELSPTSSTAASVFSAYRGAYSASPLSDTSRSPRSQPGSAAFAAVARSSVGLHTNSPSPSDAAASAALSRRGGESQRDQVRISVSSPHASAVVGMRV